MKFYIAFMIKLGVIFSPISWVGNCSALETTADSTSLEINGMSYANACESNANESLRRVVLASNVKNAGHAWLAIHTLLCGSFGSADQDLIRTIVPVKIREHIFSTGEDPLFRILKKNENVIKDLMANGEAWGARVRIASESIVLKYYPNDVCIRHVTLKNSASKWLVSEIGEACD